MHIEFTYQRNAQYFRALLGPAAKRPVRQILVLALVAAVTGVGAIAASQGDGVGTLMGFVALIVAAGLPFTARKVFVIATTVSASFLAPRRYVITDEGLQSVSAATSVHWSWQAVRRVEVQPQAYLFRQDGSSMLDVPREPLTTDQDATLRAFLAERGLLVSAA